MKLTKPQLIQILKEELNNLEEQSEEEIEIYETSDGERYSIDPDTGDPDLLIVGSPGSQLLVKGTMRGGHAIIDPTTLEEIFVGKSIPAKFLQKTLQRYYAQEQY